jgi:hypothetical protein
MRLQKIQQAPPDTETPCIADAHKQRFYCPAKNSSAQHKSILGFAS